MKNMCISGFTESYDCGCCGAVSRRNNLAITERGLLLHKDNGAEPVRREWGENEGPVFEAKRNPSGSRRARRPTHTAMAVANRSVDCWLRRSRLGDAEGIGIGYGCV